jgi:hypothetical protein
VENGIQGFRVINDFQEKLPEPWECPADPATFGKEAKALFEAGKAGCLAPGCCGCEIEVS